MIERTVPHFGRLVFDRDAIVRAALRAYVEGRFARLGHFGSRPSNLAEWTGDLERGALLNDNGCGDCEVVAWTEVGVVGLAYDLGSGPIEQLDLPIDAVTGGPDDVRGAVPGLPEELEPAFLRAVGMVGVGNHGEKLAGAGFWLCGDRVGGMLFVFDDPYSAWGVDQLAAWGLLEGDRLPKACGDNEFLFEPDEPEAVPIQAIIDAVVDRRLDGPTELTPDELATLLPKTPDPEQLLAVQRRLQEVGITWPGSPELPPETPQPRYNPFTNHPYTCPKHFEHLIECFGPFDFHRDAIVRAALRAYLESTLAPLDPLARHTLIPCIVPKWMGNLDRGAFFNGDGCGDHDVIAWTEAGLVGLAYKRGAASIEPLGAALKDLPDDLLPALEMATGLLEKGAHGENLASVGFWLHGDHAAGTLFDDPTLPGAQRLVVWGKLKDGRLPLLGDRTIAALAAMLARTTASPIHAILDAMVDRRSRRPTQLLKKELATLFPTPLDPEEQFFAAWKLQKVGITWPGIPNIPSEPRGMTRSPFLPSPKAIARCHPLGYLVFDRDAIVRAAFRAYVEFTLAFLDPRQCHPMPPFYGPTWTGDLQRGGLSENTAVAWTEAGVVAITHERKPGPTEWFSEDTTTRDPDDVRRAVPDLPDELLPAFEMAFELFNQQHSPRKKIEPVGFWLCGNRIGGTFFDTPTAHGVWPLAKWGRIGRGRLLPVYRDDYATTVTEDIFKAYAPFLAVVDAVVERALEGPTELSLDELATLFPLPPLPGPALPAQRKLQKLGITWPDSPELPAPQAD